MAVIYLFDAQKQLKKPVRDVVEIIHREGEYEAEAQITAAQKPEYGDFFGFWCADGLFRMFLVTRRETSDETGICTIAGPDAALQELESSVLAGRLALNEKTLETAAGEIIQGTDWQIGQIAPETQNKLYLEDAYYSTRWAALKKTAAAAKVRTVPYYEFAAGRVVGRKVDMISKAPVFRGLIINRRQGARNILITEEGTPYRRVFALGKIISSSEPPEQVTIANAVWSTANGDPVDKPAGQDYIEIPGAAGGEYVFEDKQEEDQLRLIKKAYDDLLSKQKPKATGIANISDTEYMPGYKHKAVRMYDLAVVRTEYGDTVATTIINIERYFVQKHLTKIEVGEEKESDLDAQIARLKVQEADTARRAGGAGAGARKAEKMVLEATEIIELHSKQILANADLIVLKADTEEVQRLEDQTLTLFNEVAGEFDAVNNALTLKASQTSVDNLGNTVNTLSAQVTLQAGQISQKVSAGEIASAINQTAQSVLIDAEKIDLKGFVTATELAATNASITNLTSGLTEASVLKANLMEAQQLTTTYLSTETLNLADTSVQFHTLSMGEIVSRKILSEWASADINLQHSHSVSVADDGTITFGEVSSSGGSFKVADTKAYKDGVSAAAAKVSLSEVGWIGKQNQVKASNGKIETVLLPEFYFTIDGWNSLHKTYVRAKYKDTKETETEAGYAEVDASSVYNAGLSEAGTKTTLHQSNFTITNTAPNTFYASVKISAKINGVTVASTTINKTQTINVGQ